MSWHKVWDDPVSNNNTDTPENCHEVTNNSDTSTVDENDIEIGNGDEPYKFLQGLNSDNLMQFSQQSALQEMILKEQLDKKPNFDVLPTFEEHDHGDYNFQLEICSRTQVKNSWIYSQSLNKVYIRMNDILNIPVFFKPKMPIQQLRIRVLLTLKKEVSEPVLRCQNHISTDTEPNKSLRQYLLRCQNQNAEYLGRPDGKSINTRLSVVVPLGINAISSKKSTVKQIIALKFTCQNSCIGRRETCLIFMLEGMNGEILSQRILDVKICSCPKRDKSIDERNITVLKRKSERDNTPPSESKVCKLRTNSRDEPDKIKQNDGMNECEIMRNSNGSFNLTLNICEKDIALNVIKYAILQLAGKMVENDSSTTKQYSKNYHQLKRLHGRAEKL